MFNMIVDRKIKVALIGCGRIAQKHFDAIKAHDSNLELVAVCETNRTRLDEIQQQHHVQGFQNYNDLLIESDADMVILCTPSGLHPEQTVSAARAGKHIMTEKPMATRWQDALAMVKACDEARKRLFVVKQNRRNATLQLLKRAYYDQGKWRGTWELDGGAFMNQASHYVDLLEWLIGPIADVQAMTGTLARDIEVEDTGVMNVRWRNGALGSMAVTMLTYPRNYEGSITIIGEKGTARVGGVAVNDIQTWEFDEEKDYDAQVKEANYQTTSVYGFGHPLYYKNVIDVLRGEAEPETDGREGLKSVEVLIAAYLSARDGKTVSLPLEY
jgi:UDP-N-acetyl-2-amino-2-deoxyglucuronate dehydrogenase